MNKTIPIRGNAGAQQKKQLGGAHRSLADIDHQSASAINSAPLTEKVKDEFDSPPLLTADQILGREQVVEDIYSENGKGDQQFLVYLNRYEVTALCLVMDAYNLESRNDVIRRFGVARAVEIAKTKLKMTEETCEAFFKTGKNKQYATKRRKHRN